MTIPPTVAVGLIDTACASAPGQTTVRTEKFTRSNRTISWAEIVLVVEGS